MTDIEDIFRSKDEPEQIWIKYKNKEESWRVFFFHENYHHMIDDNKIFEIPDYAIKGTMTVSNDGIVISAYEENPEFDDSKIASCSLAKL